MRRWQMRIPLSMREYLLVIVLVCLVLLLLYVLLSS